MNNEFLIIANYYSIHYNRVLKEIRIRMNKLSEKKVIEIREYKELFDLKERMLKSNRERMLKSN